MINKDRNVFQYNNGDVYIIITTYKSVKDFIQKGTIKYVGPLVVYKVIDPQNY